MTDGLTRTTRHASTTAAVRSFNPWRLVRRVGAGLALLLVLAVVWIVATALHARSELTAARAGVPAAEAAIRAGQGADTAAVADLAGHAQNAYDDTHNFVWAAAADIPVLGAPLATVRGLTESTDAIASGALVPIAGALQKIHPHDILKNGTIDVAAIASISAPLTNAAVILDQQRTALASLDGSWLGPVSQARTQLLSQVGPLTDTAIGAATAARLAPPMLGATSPRRYFIGLQNTAEARGTGGLLGGFAVVLADKGKLTIERTGSDNQLPPFTGTPLGLSDAYLAQYGSQGAASMWLNSNLSPHFPEVGAAWAGMWQQATGQIVDGSVALDPKALATILTATGPITAPVVGTVAADSVERLVLLGQYQMQSDANTRKQIMVELGAATIQAVLAGRADFATLAAGLATSAHGRHIFVFSRKEDEERILDSNGLTGAVDQSNRPFAQAVVVNAGGDKLDTWLHNELTYSVVSCLASQRIVQIDVKLRNDAPSSGLPTYVTVRSDKPPYKTLVGQSRVELQVLTQIGSKFVSATVDGKPLTPAPAAGMLPTTLPNGSNTSNGTLYLDVGVEGSHPSFGIDLELPPRETRNVVLRVLETLTTPLHQGAHAYPLLPLQPLPITPSARAVSWACS